MNPILIRFAAGVISIAGAAIFAWLLHRNTERIECEPGYRCQTQNQINWEPPEDRSSDRCAVCLKELRQSQFRLPCKHQLHLACAKALYREYGSGSCPLCRGEVPREYLRREGLFDEM